ncbi:serine/threonine-protein kinase PknK [Paludisphaera borealis]|uniref:Serine/threonine-protein kinase Pkn1 n=1 Tax=Paludisphaera borealis TaxID=1387353 RepID=A0A1U7CLF8_9BACT|nr:serine/threonine-protein kinase [Paludisphaera borealis]APW59747.1 Serine/threonine-protein kinase Pkn1 [Paludisphaera borealis]
MSTSEPANTDESATARFRSLWESSDAPPDLFAFLRSMSELSASERVEVVRIDQRNRWRIGRPLSLKAYLKALPDVAVQVDLVRVLIEGDRKGRLRAAWAEAPTRGEAGGEGFSQAAPQVAGRFHGDETTIVEAADQKTTPSTAPRASEARPLSASPTSVADPTQYADYAGGSQSPGSFSLDDLHESLSDAESLRLKLDAMRFTLVRRIGAGGMGVVYEAYDQERGEMVALKTMRKVDPQALVRFKHEFRSLSDIAHANLVSLFQLFAVEDHWFFTMELVEGIDFLSYVRVGANPTARGSPNERAGAPLPWSFREDRLRAALIQLANGVHYLHCCGKLHRDVKPTNVLVTEGGRVVVLDFGLTADLESLEPQGPADRQIVGTAAHMSPEQSAGREASAASDWYSVGVMLYQALTGRLPFEGSVESVMADKQLRDAAPPEALTGGLPADLASLCRDLLDRRPEKRPTGPMILDRLRGRVPAVGDPSDPNRPASIVGRSRHRRILASAYESMKSGRVETVFLYGKSGTGKTTLVRAFLEDMGKRREAVALAGRCYERESVPFKALDSLIDSLVRFLKFLPPHVLKPLLPPDVIHLARIFPVLRGVEGVAEAERGTSELPDPQEVRLRAFTGLRELLTRIGAKNPLVLVIDDLQWGDVDSAVLLADLLYSPGPPVLMFVASFRLEDAESSRFLQVLRQSRNRVGSGVNHHDLAVEPLGLTEAREMALALLHRDDPTALALAHLVARESAGNPLFIDELVKHIQAGTPVEVAAGPGSVDLDAVLLARIRSQPYDAGRLLDLVAVSGRPIHQGLAFQAGELGPSGRVALAALRSARLVRGKNVESSDEIEVYHDRIRETVLLHIAPERLAWCHSGLARAYEAAGEADPEILAVHLRGAGETSRAGAFYATAAAKAADALAFDHAAKLYRTALKLGTAGAADTRRLQVRLGDALANAGRGAEAATVYLEAAESASAAENLDLKRLASSQFLISGHVDEGMTLLRTILKPLGLSMPSSPRLALLSLAWRRGRLRLRGIRFRPRSESLVSAETLAQIDVCWSAVAGLSVIDPILGANFQTQGLLLALRAGEPYRIARALAMEAAHVATAGRSAARRVDRLIAVADDLAGRIDSPHARGIIAMVQGVGFLLMGEWRRAKLSFQDAETQFRNRCTGVTWELDTVHILSLWALYNMGELSAIKQRFATLQREAQDRGDLYAATALTNFFQTAIRIANDDSEGVDQRLDAMAGRWPICGFTVQHVSVVRSVVHYELYKGRVEDAWTRIEEVWPDFARSTLPRIQMIRIQMNELRARTALANAEQCPNSEPYLHVVERQIRRLDREPPCWCEGHVHFLRAGVAACRKDAATALHELGEAARAYAKSDMLLLECVMRLRSAEIHGGEQGRLQAESIIERMKAFGIAAPEFWAQMAAPGFSRIVSGEIDTSF